MKIGIITDSIDYRAEGIGRFIRDFCASILPIAKNNQIRVDLIHEKDVADPLYSHEYFGSKIVHSLPFIGGREFRKFYQLSKYLKREQYDVVHDMANVGPFFSSGVSKNIQTVFDLTPVLYPSFHPFASFIRTKIGFPLIKKNVHKFIAISQATKRDIVENYEIPDSNVEVIYPGLSSIMKRSIDKARESTTLESEEYALFVGTIEPRKNILGLLEIYSLIKKTKKNLKLIIIGKLGWKYSKIIQAIKSSKYAADIKLLVNVGDDALGRYYIHASIFLYPSLYEGFGLPLLEALYAKIPIVASNSGSIPEIITNPLYLSEPTDYYQFAEKAVGILDHKGIFTKELSALYSSLSRFSWEKNAQKTLQIYQSISND